MDSGSLADEGTFTLRSEGGDVTNQVKSTDKSVSGETPKKSLVFSTDLESPM